MGNCQSSKAERPNQTLYKKKVGFTVNSTNYTSCAMNIKLRGNTVLCQELHRKHSGGNLAIFQVPSCCHTVKHSNRVSLHQ